MFTWMNALSYAQYLPHVALLAMVILTGYGLSSWWVHRIRRRAELINQVQAGLLKANLALAAFAAEVTVPADVLTEFNLRRNRVLDLLGNMQDVVLRAKEGEKKVLLVLLWEEVNLQNNLWTLRRFEEDTLHTFRVDTSALIHEWMEGVRANTNKVCAEAEDRLFKDDLRYRTFAQEFNLLFLHISSVRDYVKRELARVQADPERLPTKDQVLAHQDMVQQTAMLKERVKNTISATPNVSDTPPHVDSKPKWLYH